MSYENNIPESNDINPRGFSSKKNIFIIIVAALLMIGGVGAIVAVNVTKPSSQSALTDIQIAERYLSEQNYEQAIIEFEKILEIEPMNVDAYLGLAEAYIGMGDTEKALEILREGLEQTGDESIQEMIDELTKPEEPVVSSSTSSSSMSSSSTSSTPSVTNEIVYDDEECLAIEEMIEAYLRGEGEINTSMIQNVTSLEIYGTEVVAVKCDNRGGTSVRELGSYDGGEEFTLQTRDGDEIKYSYGSIDNINEDLQFIFDIPLLKELTINFNKISDITPLAWFTNLNSLCLWCNQISDISALSGLTNLTYLELGDNQISDISVLSGLTNLNGLSLWGNQISDISALSGLTNLTELWLDENQISDISALSGITNLTTLYLSANQISDISALSGLTNLTTLWLYNNQISEADKEWLKSQLPNCDMIF